MQNWEHVEYIMARTNKLAENDHGTDFSRIRPYHLEGKSIEHRQLIMTTQFNDPIIQASFKKEYVLRYGRYIKNVPMETVTWRVIVSGKSPEILPKQVVVKQNTAAFKGKRPVYFGKGYEDCPVYDRYLLKPNDTFLGPAIIEEMESTVVIGHHSTVKMDDFKNIIVDLKS